MFKNQKQQGTWFSGSWAKVQMPCIVLTRDLYGTLDAHSSEQTGFLPRKAAVHDLWIQTLLGALVTLITPWPMVDLESMDLPESILLPLLMVGSLTADSESWNQVWVELDLPGVGGTPSSNGSAIFGNSPDPHSSCDCSARNNGKMLHCISATCFVLITSSRAAIYREARKVKKNVLICYDEFSGCYQAFSQTARSIENNVNWWENLVAQKGVAKRCVRSSRIQHKNWQKLSNKLDGYRNQDYQMIHFIIPS